MGSFKQIPTKQPPYINEKDLLKKPVKKVPQKTSSNMIRLDVSGGESTPDNSEGQVGFQN